MRRLLGILICVVGSLSFAQYYRSGSPAVTPAVPADYNYSIASRKWAEESQQKLLDLYHSWMDALGELETARVTWYESEKEHTRGRADFKHYLEVENSRRLFIIPSMAMGVRDVYNQVSSAMETARLNQMQNDSPKGAQAVYPANAEWVKKTWDNYAYNLERTWLDDKAKRSGYVSLKSWEELPDYAPPDLLSPEKKTYSVAFFRSGTRLLGNEEETVRGHFKNLLQLKDDGVFSVTSAGDLFYFPPSFSGPRIGAKITFIWYDVREKTVKYKEKVKEKVETKDGDGKTIQKEIEREQEKERIEKEFVQVSSEVSNQLNQQIRELAKEVLEKRRAILGSQEKLLKEVRAAAHVKLEKQYPRVVHDSRPPAPREKSSDILELQDQFGRRLNGGSYTLTDWEGYIANPTARFFLVPRQDATFPIRVWMRANHHRLYFHDGATFGADGPKTQFIIKEYKEKIPVYVGLWPDRDAKHEAHELTVSYQYSSPSLIGAANGGQSSEYAHSFQVKLNVWDQDKDQKEAEQPIIRRRRSFPYLESPDANPLIRRPFPFLPEKMELKDPAPFTITLDTSRDDSGFFTHNREHETAARMAADDWSYFIDDMNFDSVARGNESTGLFQGGDITSNDSFKEHKNRYPFRDFLIYLKASNEWNNSFGFSGASGKSFQQRRGQTVEIMRSGEIVVGKIDRPGYENFYRDEDWYKSDYGDDKMANIYSVVSHEVGHLLGFDSTYPIMPKWTEKKRVESLEVQDYAGTFPIMNGERHLAEGRTKERDGSAYTPFLDRMSLKGAFGTTTGFMPQRRWIITKTDLLILKAVGLKLKETSAFARFTVPIKTLKGARVNEAYEDSVPATGGVSEYYYEIISGRLPEGLTLESKHGKITGIPKEPGLHHFVLKIRDAGDSSPAGLNIAMSLYVL